MAGDKCAVSVFQTTATRSVQGSITAVAPFKALIRYMIKRLYTTRKQGPRQAASLKTNRIGFEKIHDENSG